MKEFLGTTSLVVALIGYAPYLLNVLKRRTKPHAFSWLVWSVLSGIAFLIQITHEGGAGSWLMGATSVFTLVIFVLSIKLGEKKVVFVDWVSLMFAGFALALWLITDRPLASVILISLIDAIGCFFPTFRKSIKKPYEETATLYLLFGLSLCLSVLALSELNLINALYPVSFIAINWFMGLFLVVRRRMLTHQRSAGGLRA